MNRRHIHLHLMVPTLLFACSSTPFDSVKDGGYPADAVWAPADAARRDSVEGDSAGDGGPSAIYAKHLPSTSAEYTLYRSLLATGARARQPQLPNAFNLLSLLPANTLRSFDHAAQRPQAVRRGGLWSLRLPDGGQIWQIEDLLRHRTPYLMIDASGSITLLDDGIGEGRGWSTLAVSDDGRVAAATFDQRRLLLIRLDGQRWTNGATMVDVSPTLANTQSPLAPSSVAIAGEQVYFAARPSSDGPQRLYVAPLDGSHKASLVSLPQFSGGELISFSCPRPGSAGLLLRATTRTGRSVPIIYRAGAFSVLDAPGRLDCSGGGGRLLSAAYPKFAQSPSGRYFALVSKDGAIDQLWIADLDRKPISFELLSTEQRFVPTVRTFGSVYWPDDDHLLFTAGASDQADLMLYRRSTAALSNLSRSGEKSQAPWAAGKRRFGGGWLGRNGDYLFVLIGNTLPGGAVVTEDLHALSLSTFTLTPLTNGLRLSETQRLLRSSPASTWVWFVAADPKTAGSQLYVFDQRASTPARRLTQHQDGSMVWEVEPSPDGQHVAYLLGSPPGESLRLYVVPTAGGQARALTTATSTTAQDLVWTATADALVHSSREVTAFEDLLLTSLTGQTRMIYRSSGKTHILGAYR